MPPEQTPLDLTPATQDDVVNVGHLTLVRGDRRILDDIGLRIPAGAVVGLVGRNGAGKTTLMQCLTGLAEPTSGASALFGCPSLELGDAECARLGYVAQSADLFEWMTVWEHLEAVGRAYPGWDRERCIRLAASLDLNTCGKVKDLSGGDKQKLAVVLAMAHAPELLLLDEPVASLDPLTRRAFMRALFEEEIESGRPRTIVISSHFLSDLERVVSHLAFMRQGRLQLFDAWDAILEHLRLVPAATDYPPGALVWHGAGSRHAVVDTRRAPQLASRATALTLDELFVELNA